MTSRTVLIPALTLAALALEGRDSAMEVPPEPIAATAEVDGQPGTVTQFIMALMEQIGDTMDEVSLYSQMASDAINTYDIDGAAVYAQMAADAYAELEALVPTLPGSDTPMGRADHLAMATCHLGWQYTANVLDAFNVEAMSNTAPLDSCSSALEMATAMIPS